MFFALLPAAAFLLFHNPKSRGAEIKLVHLLCNSSVAHRGAFFPLEEWYQSVVAVGRCGAACGCTGGLPASSGEEGMQDDE